MDIQNVGNSIIFINILIVAKWQYENVQMPFFRYFGLGIGRDEFVASLSDFLDYIFEIHEMIQSVSNNFNSSIMLILLRVPSIFFIISSTRKQSEVILILHINSYSCIVNYLHVSTGKFTH